MKIIFYDLINLSNFLEHFVPFPFLQNLLYIKVYEYLCGDHFIKRHLVVKNPGKYKFILTDKNYNKKG